MTYCLATIALLAACTRPAPVAPPVSPRPTEVAALGETFTVESKILGERRVINVYVPPGYASAADRYPVLYMPDGGMKEDFPHVVGSVDVSIKNDVIRPVIVVGVENTDRRRDLVSATTVAKEQAIAPKAGGADRFRAFLRDELRPLINARYRTTAETALIGESLAGLFVIETFLREPTLFDGYIAADPSLWWNQQAVARDAATRLTGWSFGPRTLYIASSVEKDIQDGVEVLTAALDRQPPVEVTWKHEAMPSEAHNTIFPTAALHGIRMVFAPRK